MHPERATDTFHVRVLGGQMKLSPRENQVWELLAQGMTCYEIADRADMKPKTVDYHTNRLYTKLELRLQGGSMRVKAARLWWEDNMPDDSAKAVEVRTLFRLATHIIDMACRLEDKLASHHQCQDSRDNTEAEGANDSIDG